MFATFEDCFCIACNGSHIKPAEEGSIWLHDGQGNMRIFMCARGHELMRVPQSPELDRCSRCPAGTYSLGPSYVDNSSLASPTEASCLACPFGSVCEGESVLPKSGYWRYGDMLCPSGACWVQASGASKCDVPKCFPQSAATMPTDPSRRWISTSQTSACGNDCSVRSIILKCPFGACLGGLCGTNNTNSSCCAPGRTGPLCAVCLPGRVLFRNECRFCVDSSLTVSSVFLALGLAIAWYILAWRPVFETKDHKLHPLHLAVYVLVKIFTLCAWIKSYVTRRNPSSVPLSAEKRQSLTKSLRIWCLSLYTTAKDKGVMSYTKVCTWTTVHVTMAVTVNKLLVSLYLIHDSQTQVNNQKHDTGTL
jgi:hypothetical protein